MWKKGSFKHDTRVLSFDSAENKKKNRYGINLVPGPRHLKLLRQRLLDERLCLRPVSENLT